MALTVTAAAPVFAAPVAPGFTYQGQLKQNGSPVNGPTHLQFSLWDAITGGNLVAPFQVISDVPVANGLFTVELNFGAFAFNGDERWLQIEICADAGCTSTTLLNPRQRLTATPYATHALGPWQSSGSKLSYSLGSVGIGTSNPHSTLELKSGFGTEVLRFGLDESDYHYISTGFHGALPWLNYLGFSLEYNSNDVRRVMTLQGDGNVGIGTATPTQKLQVTGNIFLGPAGQYSAPACEENVRIMRGSVDGNGFPSAGCCYTVTKCGSGCYDIAYNTSFADVPSVTVTPRCAEFTVGLSGFGPGSTPTASGIRVLLRFDGSFTDCDFNFTAIGTR
jgi:hypothetical protein